MRSGLSLAGVDLLIRNLAAADRCLLCLKSVTQTARERTGGKAVMDSQLAQEQVPLLEGANRWEKDLMSRER